MVTLAKVVLAATTTLHSTAIPLLKWARNKVDKITRGFICCGDDAEIAKGAHSLVNWKTVYRPKLLGGLGVTDMERLRNLRLRWPWLKWIDPDRL